MSQIQGHQHYSFIFWIFHNMYAICPLTLIWSTDNSIQIALYSNVLCVINVRAWYYVL